MFSLHIDDLAVATNRQRREFDPAKLLELQASIEKFGLMHPLVVRPDGEGKWTLVAGERRLKAIQDTWLLDSGIHCGDVLFEPGELPAISIGELDPLEAEEAELEENIRRTDLTWQEHAGALQRLEQLRIRQAEAGERLPPTLETLAEEAFAAKREGFESGATEYGKQAVRKELIVARHLDDPDVQKAKTVDDAFKVLKRKEEQAKNAALADQIGSDALLAGHQLLTGDALALISGLGGDYDCLLTDPPYGMGADEFGDSGGRVLEQAHTYADDEGYFQEVVIEALSLASAKCRPQAHAYVFCDIERFFDLRELFNGLGWKAFRTPIVWVKPGGSGRVPLPEHGPRRQYEIALYAFRGDKRVQIVQPDVIQVASDDNLGMAAQKPVALYQDLLKRSCRPGDRILDPFCGTGTIFPAAHGLKLYATGIELVASTAGIAAARLKELAQ